jgi:hypothetical protein
MENSRSEAQNIFCFAKWSLIGTGNTVKIGTTSCGAYSFASPIGAPSPLGSFLNFNACQFMA